MMNKSKREIRLEKEIEVFRERAFKENHPQRHLMISRAIFIREGQLNGIQKERKRWINYINKWIKTFENIKGKDVDIKSKKAFIALLNAIKGDMTGTWKKLTDKELKQMLRENRR